jgi:predicted ATPase
MASNSRVQRMLDEILESGKTPEEVCRDCPELLPEVRHRWQRIQLVDAQVGKLFPGLARGSDPGTPAPPREVPAPPVAYGRYQVRHTLGAGGFGTVYLGHDTQLDRPVAIKVLRSDASQAQAEGEPSPQEARRLAQLRHPGIVSVHDVGVHEGQVYIVSDYLDGPDLGQWLRENRPAWPEAAQIAAAVADALAHAHARLIVHRDVKPANILLTADRAPVLVDFGLALGETQAGGAEKGVVAGTPSYMSPEQAAGTAHRIDGRTDIYSLGVVLYEMLTGRLPFRASFRQELFRQVRDDEPQPPRQLVSDIPPELERACLKALAKRQEDRYTTATDFAADLRRILPNQAGAELTGPQPGWPPSPPISPVERHTVGREKERAELDRAFVSAAAGQGLFLCVTGEPGIGKTTLVEDFLSELAAAGRPCALARGRCSERLAGTEAYLPILEALESLLKGVGGEAAARVMKAIAPNWYAQVVSLDAENSSLTGVPVESKAASQERLKRELGAFLQELSHVLPLILFLDDLHWADASTVDVLAYLGGRCAGMRTLFVLTYRPADLFLGKHPFGPVKLDLQARGVCREMALEFLTRKDLDRYLTLEFPGDGIPEEFAALVHAQTEGSPLFMADLLRYLRDRQVLTQEQGRWTLGRSVPDLRRDLPESVRGMIQRKIDQLGEDDRRLLVAASVQGYEFGSRVVARVIERDTAEVEDRLDELDRVHAFVRVVREQELPDRTLTLRCRFVHVLYQNALYASLGPARRASLSAAVAQALLGFCGDGGGVVAAEMGLLLEAARDFSRATDYFLVAAQNAAHICANHEAVALARRGLDLLASLPDTPEGARKELALQSTLGPAYIASRGYAAPEVDPVFRRARALCERVGTPSQLFALMLGTWEWHGVRGELRLCKDFAAEGMEYARRLNDPGMLMEALFTSGSNLLYRGDFASARDFFATAVVEYDDRERTRNWATHTGHDAGVTCRSNLAVCLWHLGYPDQAIQANREAVELARQIGHPFSLAYALHYMGWLCQNCRLGTEVQAAAEEEVRIATEQGFALWHASGTFYRGAGLVQQGKLEEGLPLLVKGLDGFRTTGAELTLPFQLSTLGEAYTRAGRFEDACRTLDEGLAIGEKHDERCQEAELHRLKGELSLAEAPDQASAVEEFFRQSIETARRQHSRAWELRATMSLARFWQRQGQRDKARAELTAVYGTFTEGFTTPDLVDAAFLLHGLA